MSTYDMYFSKTNKNYMFQTLSNLILQETGYDIRNDPIYIEIYRLNYPGIFDMIDTDEISILNKELINNIGEKILKNLKKPLLIQENIKTSNREFKKPETKKLLDIYSIHRLRNSLNRFNFKINSLNKKDLSENKNFSPKTITLLKENNSLFSNDTIFIRFNDKDNISFKLKENKIIGNDEYYTYECIIDDTIKYEDILHIEIFNYLLKAPCNKNDIFKLNKIKNIKYENKKYTCLELKDNNFLINQEIGLLNKNKQYIKSEFIKNIIDNYILIEYIDFKDIKYCLKMNQNISIKILV